MAKPRPKIPPAIENIIGEIEDTQVVIMAGGLGRRMGLDVPKPLVKLAGKTLLDRCIEYYRASGYRDIVVLTGHRASEVEEHLAKTHPEAKVCRDPWPPGEKPLGKAKALKHALLAGAIDKSRRAIIAFPDDVFLDPYLPIKLLTHHLQGATTLGTWATAVFAYPANYPYGAARIDSRGLAVKFQEKPKVKIPTSTGIYLFEPEVYKMVMQVDMDAPRPVEFEETIIPRLAEKHRLYAYTIPGDLWIPINTRKDLEKAEKALTQHQNPRSSHRHSKKRLNTEKP